MRGMIQTLVLKFNAAGVVDLPRLQHVRDVSFWNPTAAGTSNPAQITVGGVVLDLLPGDPILSFGGYDNAFRNDVIQIDFTGGGDNNLIVLANKYVEI
jgi:hypothetical protein